MYIIAGLGFLSFILCFIFTPLCRIVAIRLKWLDQPDRERKLHTVAVPRLGGFAIVAAYGGALWLVVRLAPASEQVHFQHLELIKVLLPAAVVIFVTGLIDDLVGLKPKQKLLGQIAGAALAIALGSHFTPGVFTIAPGLPLLASPWINFPLTLLWLVFCTNAVNLIDGMDGLASGVGLLATISTLLVGVFTGNSGLVLATMPLAGALLAFLYYNFEPASIYLGDCGSLTIGFMLGSFCLVWSHHSRSLFSLAAPLMVLVLPLLDSALAIARRYLRAVPIFQADRGHIHHMVLARGFKTRHATLLLYAACAVAASLALLQSFAIQYLHIAIFAVFAVLVCVGVHYLGYVELGAISRAFVRRDMMRAVRDQIYLEDLERHLVTLRSLDECWATIVEVCERLQFAFIEMYFQEEFYEATLRPDDADCDWTMTVPLGERGFLRLRRQNQIATAPITMQVIERLQRTLGKRERLLSPIRRAA